jgi:hypothetical protein
MLRWSSTLVTAAFFAALPARAQEPARIIEVGITGGVAHHDFHYRYPGEGRWQDPLGFRLDARVRTSDRSAVGIAIVGDRYVYSDAFGVCVNNCVPVATGPGNGDLVAFSTAWQLTRIGIGATWQRKLFGPVHGNVGVLTGYTWRQTLDGAPQHGSLPDETREWFAGGEAGFTAHLRDLAFGLGGEYGRVPRTTHALSPYYSRIVGRIAYRTAW